MLYAEDVRPVMYPTMPGSQQFMAEVAAPQVVYGPMDQTFGEPRTITTITTVNMPAFQAAPAPLTKPAMQPSLLARALPGVDTNAPLAATTPLLKRVEQDDFTKWHNLRSFIAYMFTFISFVVLAPATIVSIQLGMDVDASFWIGRWGLLAIAVPIFLLGQHFYHTWMLEHAVRRRRYIFIVVPVLPAVLFMIIGGVYMSSAKHLYGQLKANDCDSTSSLPGKMYMQEAYEEARGAYGQCLLRLKKENMGKPLRNHPVLQSCDEWGDLLSGVEGVVPFKGYKVDGALRQHSTPNDARWQYLANTELNHLCGGFCKQGPPLFASYDLTGRSGGSCSQFVAFRFLAIWHWATVVFAIGTMVLALSIPTYLSMRPMLTNMGYKSGLAIA